MKKVLRKKVTVFGLFLLLFFTGAHVLAFDVSTSNQETFAPFSVNEEKKEGVSDQSSEGILDRKTFQESDVGLVFEKENDGMLKAPPTFDDGGTYPPGGQVNPILPLNNGALALLAAVFIYAVIRLFRLFRTGKAGNKT